MKSHDPFAWVVLLKDAIGFAIAFGGGTTLWLRKRSARYWPLAFGKVEHASSFENSGTWLTDISYSYRVETEFYSGQMQLKSRSERAANDQIARWKERNVGIRYSPRKPAISVLRMEDQAGLVPEEFRGH